MPRVCVASAGSARSLRGCSGGSGRARTDTDAAVYNNAASEPLTPLSGSAIVRSACR